MTYTAKAGSQQPLSFLFPELSSQRRRAADPFLPDTAAAGAEASLPIPTAEVAAPLRDDAIPERDVLESSDGAPSGQGQGAVFQKAVTIASTPEVAMNSHQVLSDSLPGAAAPAAAGSMSMAPSCGCRACSVLAVSSGDGAEAWDTTIGQAPLVMDGVVSLGAGVDLSKTFLLHSNPTATKTIFLDFDGYAINNTPWENGGNLKLGGFYSTLDSAALTEIQRIWQRVAEDFAPFNVNITTEDPGTENLRKYGTADDRWGIRVAFTSNVNLLTGKAIINAGGGGTAYYNSFNWSTDDVALVFNRGEYSAAATASHEVGHTLNLTHDGAGTSTVYYAGHGGTGPTSWGTIMGAPYLGDDENVTQWSKGEYTAANNTQDDLAVITGNNGFSYAADDHGSSFTTATALTGLTFSSFGVIERNTDIDMFRFETLAGQVSFNIVNASRAFVGSAGSYVTEYLTSRGPNLDIAASLYRADGSLLQTFNPAALTTASFSTYLDAGTYYLGLDGVGAGTPLASTPSGYTDYGSLGQYMVSGTLPSTSQPPPIPEVLDPNGTVELLRDPGTDLVSVRSNGVITPVGYQGAQLKAAQFTGWQVIAAETVASNQNQMLWKKLATGEFLTWSLDSNWNQTSISGTFDPNSSTGLLLQEQFMVDANGTPLTSTLPLISLAVSPASVVENGAANLIYTFSRTGATTNPLTVNYSIGGTATNGSDYGLIPASVTFAAGSATATVTIDPTADAVVEPDETVSLTLQPNAAYSIGTAGAVTGTILNDDAATTLQVLDPNGAVELLRDPGTDLVSVRSNGVITPVGYQGAQLKAAQFTGWQVIAAETVASNQNQMLWKKLATGEFLTWSLDSNWNQTSISGTFDPNSSTGLLLQEQFMVDANGTPLTSTLPLISLAVSPASVVENGAANLIYTFSRTGATTNPLTVNYSIGGTATNGSDYGLIPASVTFAAGSATATVTIDPTADAVVEPDETVSLTLQPNAAYSIGTAGAVTGTILNDDAATTLQVLDPNGTVELLRDPGTDLVSVRSNGVITPVGYQGAQLKAAQFTGWQVIAAETVASNQNQMLWKKLATGEFLTWSLDSNWNQTSISGTFDPNSSTGLLLQEQFMVDANGTPLTSTLPLISLAVSPASVVENGAANLIYTFSRTGATTNPLTVNYSIGGTATNGSDYGLIPASVTFAAGSATATVTIDPTADAVVEPDETVSLTLQPNAAYSIGTAGAVTGTILNDDAATTLQVLDPNGAVELLRDPGTDLVSVRSNGVITPVGYQGAQLKAAQFTGWQVIAAETVASNQNQMLWKKLATGEFLTWSLDSNWNQTSISGTFDPNSSTGLLLQEQFMVDANGTPLTSTLPLISLAVSPASVVENGAANLIYTFSRTGATTNPLTVNYSIGGTATNGSDYGLIPASVTFAAGSATATVTIDPTADAVVEPDETVSLTLQPNAAYSIGTAGAVTGTILNDDAATTLQVLDPNGTVELLRDPGTDLVSVRSNGVITPVGYQGAQLKAAQFTGWQVIAAETVASNQNQMLWKKLATGEFLTWSLDSNWNQTSISGTFDPNSSTGLLLQEQFMVDANGTPLTSTLPLISLAVSPASVVENGAANLIYTFSRTGATTNPLTVNYSIGGTATNGSDYGLIPASVTFAAGSATATVTIDPTADAVVEPDETVSLTLQPNAAYSIGTAGAVTGTILNDDAATPPPPTTTLQVLDPNGAVQLLRDISTDLVSIQANGVATPVSENGAQIKLSQFTGSEILAAEANSSGQNQLLWKQISDGKFYTWTLDSQGNLLSSSAGYKASSSQGRLLQQQFMVDANGTPLTSQTQDAATDGASALIATGNSALVDPIIGSSQGFTPELDLDPAHDFDHDHGACGDFLPLDLTTFDPGLLLGVLATTGEADRTPADPMASLFPAASSIPSPTTPWLAATQSLL